MVSRAQKEQATDGPFDIGNGKRAWYYVDKDGVSIISQVHHGKDYIATAHTTLKKNELKRMHALLERA